MSWQIVFLIKFKIFFGLLFQKAVGLTQILLKKCKDKIWVLQKLYKNDQGQPVS